MSRPLPSLTSTVACSIRRLFLWGAFLIGLGGAVSPAVAPRDLGDVNSDGELSVVDLTLLRRHVRGLSVLPKPDEPFADVNQDGVVNEDDARALIRLITGEDKSRELPLAGIRETSPVNGEEAVSSGRRTGIILRFTLPIKDSPKIQDREVFNASVNGVRLNSRAELSSDGRKLVLFVTDKIPGNSRVDVRLDTAGLEDLLGRKMDGDGDGAPGGVFKFYYITESLIVVPETQIRGKVFASEKVAGKNVPLQGVIVRVAGTEDKQVLTAADGSFTLDCPAGRFFAEVDGRKVMGADAFPEKAYYPFVVKAWEAVAGSKENLAVGTGEIFLPLIPAGALKAVDPNKETKVGAPASVIAANPQFAEISLSVPAGALRKEDGTVGGRIGMAPVPPDRLPEPLAPGLGFPLVITIQTDGAGTFDQPVAVKFPNLPDQDGNLLKPGQKTGLWSFNHDTGSWELQGPMTVTDDGKYVTTDPGVGVRQPGWHGVLPGSQGVGPKRAASAPELPKQIQKEVDEALQIAAHSSLPVRDAFMALGGMRSAAEDLEEIVRLLQELQSMVAAYDQSGEVPFWWSFEWLKLRITKLEPSYSALLAGASGDLGATLGRMQPQLDSIKRSLNALLPFNQMAYGNAETYTWLSTQFADSNAALLYVLNAVQPYLDSLRAGAPLFSPTAFEDVRKVLTRGFNEPALSRAQEMEALAKFLQQMQPVLAVVAVDHSEQLRTLKLQMSDYLARAGALSIASGKIGKYGYIKVDAIGEPQRVRSNAAGDYRMVLPPDREFAVTFVDPKTLRIGAYVGISGWNGTITELYGPVLAPLQPKGSDPVDLAYAVDTDGDKLADVIETVIGTDLTKVDSDGDSASDHQEVTRGKNPLSGMAVGTGVIFSAAATVNFESTDVDAGNDMLFVSEQRIAGEGVQGGLVVYSLESKTEPLRQSWLPVESPVYRVRYGDTNLAVLALHENGVAIVDVSSPTSPVLRHQYPVGPGESVNSAILVGDILVLGVNDSNTGTARIVLKNLESGETIREETAGGSISDIVANGTFVYALSKGNRSNTEWWYWAVTSAVFAGDVNRAREPLAEGQSLFRSVTVREWEFSKSGGRLALAAGKLFYVYESGLTVLDLANPLTPVLEGDVFKPNSGFQLGWRHVLFDGSVDASNKMTFLAALGASGRGNSDEDGDVAVFKYGRVADFGDTTSPWWKYWLDSNTPMAEFVTQFDSRAENPRQQNLASGRVYSLALAGGIVYAADKEQGLKVVNYRRYDSAGKAPSLNIRINSPSPPTLATPRVKDGDLLALTAVPSDDVAVASVEWYVDGVRVAVTGGAPWGYTVRLPFLEGVDARRIRVEARAYDTGGNMTASEREIDVVRDAVPPTVLTATPSSSQKEVSSIGITFSEPMDQSSLSGKLTLRSAGADGKLGTADDVLFNNGLLSSGSASLTLDFASALPEGFYRAVLSGAVTDVAGNPLGSDYTWDFGVAQANMWLGGSGLWSDSTKWSSGAAPVAGESVVFPAGAVPNLVVGGRAAFRPTAESLFAGTATFTRVLSKGLDGVVRVVSGGVGTSTTPIYPGMQVKGAMLAEGTYVKSVQITEDLSDPSNQRQTTVFELSQPLVEGAPGAALWTFTSGGNLDAVTVQGDTTLVDVDLALSGTVSLRARLDFGGNSTLGVGTLTTSGSQAVLSAAAAVETGSLLAGKTNSGAARLKLTQPLVLSGSLELESAGFRAADGKLTSSVVQLSEALDLAGHELRIHGGYAGSVALQASLSGGTFALRGAGRLAFDWKASLFETENADWEKPLMRVSTGRFIIPEDVTLDVAGYGKVSFFANKFSNYGTVRISDQGRLTVYNYERVGTAATELLGQDAVFDKLETEEENDSESLFASTGSASFALKQDGSLWAWGYNWQGRLGVGSTLDFIAAPTQVGADTDWRSVRAFGNSTFAMKRDGSLWAWGQNSQGRLGVESTAEWISVPMQVGTFADWKSVDGYSIEGISGFVAMKQDGSLWAWGANWGGTLGVGSTLEVVNAPTQVGTDTDWKSVRALGISTFAMKQDGSLWAWGHNNFNGGIGFLGVGSTEEFVTSPTQVGVDRDWKLFTSRGYTVLGLKQDGSLWAWGGQMSGQLGIGSVFEVVKVPTRVGDGADWKSVTSDWEATFALKQDGSLWAWGNNWDGGLGVGSPAQFVTVPTRVGTDTDWKFVTSLFGRRFAFKQDGSLWTWGSYWVDGNAPTVIPVPTRVGTDVDWMSVTNTGGSVFAHKSDGSLWAWGSNWSGQLGVGSEERVVTVPTRVDMFADSFHPAVSGVTPDGVRREVARVSVAFSEPMNQTTLNGSLTLHSAGPDGQLGTADDIAVPEGILSGGSASVTLDFTNPLPEGLYRAVLSRSVADVAGNTLGADYTWDFGVALTNQWLGGSGLWSDPAKWSYGKAPVAGDAVVFPQGAEPNLVVGGRATFMPSPGILVAGNSIFTRVLSKGPDGVVAVVGGGAGTSTTPIYPGMRVKGAMLAEGTYVKAVTVTEDVSDPSNQLQTTVFELSQPLPEGGPLASIWTFTVGSDFHSVTVMGDTTLVDVDLALSGTLSLSGRLNFGGNSTLGVGTLTTSGSQAVLSAAAAVETGSLVAGKTNSGAALLKLTQPLVLSGSLALESAGFRAADGKLTSSAVQLREALDLAGHELRIYGGYAGSVTLQALLSGGTFSITGPGSLAFDWKGALLDEEGVEWDKLAMRVNAGHLVLPADVTLDVAGLGQVNLFSSKLTNSGTVRVAEQGWLRAYNYEPVGTAATEVLGRDARFEKLDSTGGEGSESTLTYTHAIKQDGTLWAWGQNEDWGGGEPVRGILGTGSDASWINEPEKVGSDDNWREVFGNGYSRFFAIKTDGTLWAWGRNSSHDGLVGILGVGSDDLVVTSPQRVGSDDQWKSVKVGWNGAVALKTDGSLWAWGDNEGGRLGIVSESRLVKSPARIESDQPWKAVFDDWSSYYGVKMDGSLWTWGVHSVGGDNLNFSGLGDELSMSGNVISTPTRVGEDTNWRSVSLTQGRFAVKTDGTLWAWGDNWVLGAATYGTLGVGSQARVVTTPTKIGEDENWDSVISASFPSANLVFARKVDGSLWSWGYRDSAESQYVKTPKLVPSDVPWVGLPRGTPDGSMGVKSDGSLWKMSNDLSVLTQVGEQNDWVGMVGDYYTGRILKRDGSLWRFSYQRTASGEYIPDVEPVEIKTDVPWKR